MANLERIRAAKREYENKINYVDYDSYNSDTLAGVKYRVIGIDLGNNSSKIHDLIEEQIESLGSVSQPESEEEWARVKQKIDNARGFVKPQESPLNSSEQSVIIGRIWNILIAVQLYVEEDQPINI